MFCHVAIRIKVMYGGPLWLSFFIYNFHLEYTIQESNQTTDVFNVFPYSTDLEMRLLRTLHVSVERKHSSIYPTSVAKRLMGIAKESNPALI